MKIAIAIAYLAAVLAALYGWGMNIVSLVGMLGGDVTAMFIARIVGVFAFPVGVILGFL